MSEASEAAMAKQRAIADKILVEEYQNEDDELDTDGLAWTDYADEYLDDPREYADYAEDYAPPETDPNKINRPPRCPW